MALWSDDTTMESLANRRRHERPALRAALELAGFLVFDASVEGRERERLRDFWAALILLDLPMPGMGAWRSSAASAAPATMIRKRSS
jgi:DNA-binding response OmpR family regulator